MMRPQPPRPRIMRRKTVSVTPAMGARTVPGEINLLRIEKDAESIFFTVISRRDSGWMILQRMWRARQRRRAQGPETPGAHFPSRRWKKDARLEPRLSRRKIL